MYNDLTQFLRCAAALTAASTLALFLGACAEKARIEVGPAGPDKSASEQRAPDPALRSLEGVTQHG